MTTEVRLIMFVSLRISPIEFWGPPTFGFFHVLSLYGDQEDAVGMMYLRDVPNVFINLLVIYLKIRTKNIDMKFLRDTESAPLRGGLHRRAP